MKKKEYIAPSCEVVEMEIVSMIATSFTPGEEEENDRNEMSNKHRGEWGNLWRTNE